MMFRLDQVIGWQVGDSEGDEVKITVDMHYLPTLSVNRYKTALGITRHEVKDWMGQLAWVVQWALEISMKPPIKVRVEGEFKNKRSTPDLHNLHKVICDAVQDGLLIDDKHFQVEDGVSGIADPPRLRITIKGRVTGQDRGG